MSWTRIKICGITNVDDALAAAEAGADRIGFVFAESPRRVDAEAAREIRQALRRSPRADEILTVGVFMNQGYDEVARIAAVSGVEEFQFHGDENPADYMCQGRAVIRRVRVVEGDTAATLGARVAACVATCMTVLLDPGAGSGRAFDWRLAADLSQWIMLSGGLRPENVAEAIGIVQPWGVDVSSGVESSPGRKDREKVRAFVQAVRMADDDRARRPAAKAVGAGRAEKQAAQGSQPQSNASRGAAEE